MNKSFKVTTGVRQLLLEPTFIVRVFDSDDDCLDTDVRFAGSSSEDIDTARYILLHLEDFCDLFTKEDLEDVKNRIKECLKG